MTNIISNMIPGVGGGNGAAVELAEQLSTEHIILSPEPHGSLAYDTGALMHNLIKPSNDGMGADIGTGQGDINLLLGTDNQLRVSYSASDFVMEDAGPGDTNSPAVTSFTTFSIPYTQHKIEKAMGVWTVTPGIDFRMTVYREGTSVILAQTCDNETWEGGIVHGYGGIVQTIADGYTLAELEFLFSITTDTVVDVKYEFRTPVVMRGTGTWDVDWFPDWQDESIPLIEAQVVFYDAWAVKTFGINDKIVEAGVIYRCNTAGAQTGTFAANSAKWTEVGNIPSVLLWKGGISVADFNALASGVEGGMYRLSSAGTLTGGQAAVIGDQVILNTDISATVQASEFDFFENIEPGTVIPPWTAKTYVVDESIYEQGQIYYCATAGSQITDFATNVALWSNMPEVSSIMRFDADGDHSIGSAAKSAKRVYITQGIYYNTERRLEVTATETNVQSPDGNTKWKAENAILRALINGFSRINLTASELQFVSPDGNQIVKLDNASWSIKKGAQYRFISGTVAAQMHSPDGSAIVSVANGEITNTGFTKLGAAATGIQQKVLVGTTENGTGWKGFNHGLGASKILAVDILVTLTSGSVVGPEQTKLANNTFSWYIGATELQIGGCESSVKNRPFTALITYKE